MVSSTVEDYLKAILRLQAATGTATVGQIARELAVTPGTVTTMMRHLSDRELVDYAPRRGLRLLPTGEAEALKVVRRHRLLETFLVEVMKLDSSEVHEEAEVLEHVLSDRLLNRMDEMLGHPTHDPHGDPIPDKEGRISQIDASPLAEVEDGEYRVVRISDENSDLLGWLNQKGVTIGEEVQLSHRDRAAGLLEIKRVGGEHLQLGIEMAGQVYVEAL